MRRLVLGFLLAPVVPILLAFAYVAMPMDPPFIPQLALAFGGVLLIAYVMTVLVAVPLYMLVWRFLRVNLMTSMLSAAFVALLVFAAFAWPTVLYDSSDSILATLNNEIPGAGFVAGFGASIGLMFWIIAVRNNPIAERRQTG